MELRHYLVLLWRWAWLIVLGAVLAAGAAYLMSSSQPPMYQATVTLLINQASTTTQDYNAIVTGERLARTYAQLMTKRPVMEQTIRELGLTMSPESLANKVRISLVRDTQLLTLQVLDEDPARATLLANKIPVVFAKQNEEMQLKRYQSSKQNLEKQMAAVDADIKATEATLEVLKAQPVPDSAEVGRLSEQLLQYRTTYSNLLRSYEEIRMAEAKTLDTVTVVEPAVPPEKPIGPATLNTMLLAAMVGVMLAIGVAFLVEYLDDTIKTDADVLVVLGLPTLGGIVDFGKQGAPAIAVEQPKSVAVEAYRALRTNIRFASPDRQPRTLLVTSPFVQEGKTTTVANLGAVFARAGVSTLIVDADLRKPRLHRVFQVDNHAGLTTALISDEIGRMNGSLKEAGIPNLRILASGPRPPNPSELLSSERMGAMIGQLSREADVVLLDTPPCLAVSDAAVLASKVDGILLVLEAGKTRREAALRAKETLEQVGGRILGVVLTKIPTRRRGYDYYRYYYYYPEYYRQEADGGHGDSRT